MFTDNHCKGQSQDVCPYQKMKDSADDCDKSSASMHLQQANMTISSRDVLIKMQQEQLRKLEKLYMKNVEETQRIRYKYCTTAKQLEDLRRQMEEKGTNSVQYPVDMSKIEDLINRQTTLILRVMDKPVLDPNSTTNLDNKDNKVQPKEIKHSSKATCKARESKSPDRCRHLCTGLYEPVFERKQESGDITTVHDDSTQEPKFTVEQFETMKRLHEELAQNMAQDRKRVIKLEEYISTILPKDLNIADELHSLRTALEKVQTKSLNQPATNNDDIEKGLLELFQKLAYMNTELAEMQSNNAKLSDRLTFIENALENPPSLVSSQDTTVADASCSTENDVQDKNNESAYLTCYKPDNPVQKSVTYMQTMHNSKTDSNVSNHMSIKHASQSNKINNSPVRNFNSPDFSIKSDDKEKSCPCNVENAETPAPNMDACKVPAPSNWSKSYIVQVKSAERRSREQSNKELEAKLRSNPWFSKANEKQTSGSNDSMGNLAFIDNPGSGEQDTLIRHRRRSTYSNGPNARVASLVTEVSSAMIQKRKFNSSTSRTSDTTIETNSKSESIKSTTPRQNSTLTQESIETNDRSTYEKRFYSKDYFLSPLTIESGNPGSPGESPQGSPVASPQGSPEVSSQQSPETSKSNQSDENILPPVQEERYKSDNNDDIMTKNAGAPSPISNGDNLNESSEEEVICDNIEAFSENYAKEEVCTCLPLSSCNAEYKRMLDTMRDVNLKMFKMQNQQYLEMLSNLQDDFASHADNQYTKQHSQHYLDILQQQLEVTAKIEVEINKLKETISKRSSVE